MIFRTRGEIAPAVETNRSEALSILKKWHAERTPLRCQIPLRQLAAAFNARVYSVSDTLLVLTSDDLLTELNIPFSDSLFFGYGDTRHDPDEVVYDATLIIFLESIPLVGRGDMIILREFKEPPLAV